MKFKGNKVKFVDGGHTITDETVMFELTDIKGVTEYHEGHILQLADGKEVFTKGVELTSGFEEIWEMQYALNKHTLAKNEQDDYDTITGKSKLLGTLAGKNLRTLRNKWVKNYNLAMQQECAELLDSTNWKWWRTKKDLFDEQNISVELIDILHFWMSACQVMGLTPEDVYRMYKAKNQVNYDRQKVGYVEKDENDSKHIE